MVIIDFKRKGNLVRFYLGEKIEQWGWTNKDYKDSKGETPSWLEPSDTYYGDDWDDRPYEHNAGRVYDEFIKGYKDIAFGFDDIVLEPYSGCFNSSWCKDDMVDRRIPCIIVIPKSKFSECGIQYEWEIDSFYEASLLDCSIKYYFGDEMEADVCVSK